jgi:hypothetical protein
MTKIDPGSSHGVESFLKQLRVAKNKGSFSEFERQVARRKLELGLGLSVLGPYFPLNK